MGWAKARPAALQSNTAWVYPPVWIRYGKDLPIPATTIRGRPPHLFLHPDGINKATQLQRVERGDTEEKRLKGKTKAAVVNKLGLLQVLQTIQETRQGYQPQTTRATITTHAQSPRQRASSACTAMTGRGAAVAAPPMKRSPAPFRATGRAGPYQLRPCPRPLLSLCHVRMVGQMLQGPSEPSLPRLSTLDRNCTLSQNHVLRWGMTTLIRGTWTQERLLPPRPRISPR